MNSQRMETVDNLAILTNGLSKQFGKTVAVENLNLCVPRGSIFGFLGPNGAGKSTTIRMLLGLVKPTGGTGKIFGFDSVLERDKIAPKVGAIVETPAFYSYLSAAENLRVIALSSGVSLEKSHIASLLEKVGLQNAGEKKVSKYSLGMKQRLGIATTLLTNPELLFLDEPA